MAEFPRTEQSECKNLIDSFEANEEILEPTKIGPTTVIMVQEPESLKTYQADHKKAMAYTPLTKFMNYKQIFNIEKTA